MERTADTTPDPELADTPAAPEQVPEAKAQPSSKKRRRWVWPVAALVVGLLIGTAVGRSDPTKSDEYQALQSDLSAAEEQIDTAKGATTVAVSRATAAEGKVQAAEAAAKAAQDEAAARGAELDTREAALAAREQAVTATEQRIANTSIGEGTWTVGRDVEPGTYRTTTAVSGQCYWGIHRSGSNGSDIIDNDIVTGGFPTVTLREGQDFTNRDCGTFIKQ
jgi:hypothetical protein